MPTVSQDIGRERDPVAIGVSAALSVVADFVKVVSEC